MCMFKAKYLLVYAFLVFFILAIPLLTRSFFFCFPAGSPNFDCDDSTLLMYNRLSSVGIESVAIAGNLKTSNEKYEDIDHVWLLARIGGWQIAFDWGVPEFDRQHYEGFTVTREKLVEWVEYDHAGQMIAAR